MVKGASLSSLGKNQANPYPNHREEIKRSCGDEEILSTTLDNLYSPFPGNFSNCPSSDAS